MKSRIVVIGGLAAGPAAAAKAKRTDPDAVVTMYEAGENVSYGICEIPYWIGGIITSPGDMNPFSAQRLEQEKGIVVHTQHFVERIDPVARTVHIRDLWRRTVKEEEYSRLIIATGGGARRLGVANEEARNVFRIRSLNDGQILHKYLAEEHPHSAIVIGGGYLGLEMCEAFVKRGLHVTLVCREEGPMAKLAPSVRSKIADILLSQGITLITKSVAAGFEVDSSGKALAVRTDACAIPGDLFLVAIGVEPNAGIAREAGLRIGTTGGIATDERMGTSADSIFAAGDCCETRNLVSNRPAYIPLATTASRQGRVAGENAAGGHATYKGALRAAAMKLFDTEIGHVGLTRCEAIDLRMDVSSVEITSSTKVQTMPGSAPITIVGLTDTRSGRIVGADLIGGEGTVQRTNILAMALQAKLTLKELQSMDFAYAPPFGPLWDPILTLASSASKPR